MPRWVAVIAAGVDVVLYDESRIEPTDQSFRDAARFAGEGGFDGYVSVGGGSVIDTAKAANLYATHPAEFLTYVNAPIGGGVAVPGPLKPHIACPTTCGTGSECTGIAVFDLLAIKAKTGIVSRHMRPSQAVVDPTVTATLPATVVMIPAESTLRMRWLLMSTMNRLSTSSTTRRRITTWSISSSGRSPRPLIHGLLSRHWWRRLSGR